MPLQALIMAGGEGSRLRPLTCDTPKPMVPILGRPVLDYSLMLLRKHGLLEVGLTLQYLPERITRHYGFGAGHGVSLRYCREREPLGTAGGVLKAASGRFAPSGTFVVLSGDGLTDCNLTQALAFHRQKGALATLVLSRVRNPLAYGVVITDEDGRVLRFVEKPGWGEVYSDTVNTGIYLLEPEVLSHIPADTTFDFGKDLFPYLVAERKAVYAFVPEAYWCDIGDQAAYVQAQADFLLGRVKLDPGPLVADTAQIDGTARITGPVFLGEGCRVGPHSHLSDCAVLGANVSIGSHGRVARSVLWEEATVMPHAQLRGAVICRGGWVGAGAAVLEDSVLGDNAVLGNRASLESGAKVWPGKRIDPCMRVTENLVWDSAGRPTLSGGSVEARDPSFACLLAAAWAEASEASAIAIAYDGDLEGRALCAAASGALLAQGIRVIALGQGTLPVLRQTQRMLGIPAGLFFRARRITLTAPGGCPPPRVLQRKVETLFVRQDFARPFSRAAAAFERVTDADALYVGRLAASVSPNAFAVSQPPIAVFPQNPAHGELVTRVLRAAGLHGRVSPGKPHLHRWETGFLLSGTGETATVFDSQGTPDEARQSLIAYDSLGGGEWLAAVDAPAALETLAAAHGAKVRRVSPTYEEWANALLMEDTRQFDLHFDGMYRILRITERLAGQGTTLRGLLVSLPPVYRYAERIPCPLPDRGKLLAAIAESEGHAELNGSLRLARESGFLTVNPDEREAEMVVVGEAASMEAAKELCGELMERLRKGMQSKE